MFRPKITPATYRKVTWAATASLGVIIVSGAAVRLTGSGLGCPDWPNCTASSFRASFSYHPMIEFANRMFTGVVSVAVILAVLGSLVRSPRRRDLTWLSLGLVAGVVAQILLGAVTVLTDLTPPVVAAHFLLSMVLVTNGVVLTARAADPDGRGGAERRVRQVSSAMVLLVAAAMVAGTVVTGAGPHGGDEHVKRLDLNLTWVTRVHSGLVWLLLGATLTHLWLRRRAPERVRVLGYGVLWALAAQGLLGYVQYAAGVPEALVLIHVAGATTVLVFVVRLWLGDRGLLNLATGAADGSGARPGSPDDHRDNPSSTSDASRRIAEPSGAGAGGERP
jgi:cytochrome c oxidase assembly protein subunit 15